MSTPAPGSATTSIDEFWSELVTAALLGTDRRVPPTPPAGPVADVVADAVRPDDAARMLVTAAALAAARRAAFVAGPVVDLLQPPPPDDRPWCTPAAAATWREVVREWPVLEDEWVLTVLDRGIGLPPDVLVELLMRHRGDAVRRARVALVGGHAVDWLVGHLPDLAATTGARPIADAVTTLPELAVPPELAELVTVDARTFVERVVPGVVSGGFGPAHRAVLVNLIARCRPAVLPDAAAALDDTRVGLALALADLARLRHRMLVELGVTP